MIPAIDILANAQMASNWPSAMVQIVTAICAVIGAGLTTWVVIEQIRSKTILATQGRAIEATSKAISETNQKVEYQSLKVGHLGEILNEQGQRIDGRLTELLIASIAKAHAEGMLAGTKDEQARAPDAKKMGPTITPIQPVEIVNPAPIPVTQTPEQRLGEIRGDAPK